MSQITIHNFDDKIQGSGLEPIEIDVSYESGEPMDLSGATIIMQLRNSLDVLGWEFSTRDTADTVITGTSDGVILIPEIKEWNIAPTLYNYDVQVIDKRGFVGYVLKGTWRILPHVSRV